MAKSTLVDAICNAPDSEVYIDKSQSGQSHLMNQKDMPTELYANDSSTAAIQALKSQVRSRMESERQRLEDIKREGERTAAGKKLHKQRIDMLAEVVQYLEIQEAISMARRLSLDSDYVVCAFIVAGEKREKRIRVGTVHDVLEEEALRGGQIAVHTFAEFRGGRDRWTEEAQEASSEDINEAIPY